jgi:hypothetical protein
MICAECKFFTLKAPLTDFSRTTLVKMAEGGAGRCTNQIIGDSIGKFRSGRYERECDQFKMVQGSELEARHAWIKRLEKNFKYPL